MKSEITVNGTPIKVIHFPGGEMGVNINSRPDAFAVVFARICDPHGVMALINTVYAVREYTHNIDLILPYVPYARQDRVCNEGESLSIKAFADMINMLGVNEVVICDPHSDVAPALIDRCRIIPQSSILRNTEKKLLVAPDFGATKKIEKFCQPYIQGTKQRDLETGQLSGFGFHGDVEDQDLLIVDDICDGGGTFIGLANELRNGGAKSVSLYVTHGIFSKGLGIFNGVLDEIWTTNSLPQVQDPSAKVNDLPGYKGFFKVMECIPA